MNEAGLVDVIVKLLAFKIRTKNCGRKITSWTNNFRGPTTEKMNSTNLYGLTIGIFLT